MAVPQKFHLDNQSVSDVNEVLRFMSIVVPSVDGSIYVCGYFLFYFANFSSALVNSDKNGLFQKLPCCYQGLYLKAGQPTPPATLGRT